MCNFGLDLFDILYKYWNYVYFIFIFVKEFYVKLRKCVGLMKGLCLYGFIVKLDYYKVKILYFKWLDENK